MNLEMMRYLPTFLLASEELSFSAAARRLGLTPAAVSKSVRTLEQGLGLRLFHRSTHALTLTDEGERLRRRVAPLLDALDESLAKVKNLPETPRGLLRVAAPYSVGKLRLLPLLEAFRARYPEVDFDLRLDDRVIDLVKERIDVSIGVRMDPNPALIGKKLYDTQAVTVASPKYLKEHGVPQRPGDVERFACIRYRTLASGRLFPWLFTDPATGSTITMNPSPSLIASSLEIVAELAAAHHGLALAGLTGVQPYLRDGSLVQVLSEYSYAMPPMMLYYTSKHDLPSRVRVFIEFVSEHLQDASGEASSAG